MSTRLNPISRHPGPAGCLACLGYGLILLAIGAVAGLSGLAVPFLIPMGGLAILAGSWVAGLLFRFTPLRQLWERVWFLALLCGLAGLALYFLGLAGLALYFLGLAGIQLPEPPPDVDPDSLPLPSAGLWTYTGLFMTVFAVHHWPAKQPGNVT